MVELLKKKDSANFLGIPALVLGPSLNVLRRDELISMVLHTSGSLWGIDEKDT